MRRLALLFAVLAAGVVFGQAEPNVQPDPKRFEKTIADFEKWDSKNSFPPNGVLFVGSSSIVMWQTRRAFEGLPVINRGFGGSHISDVNFYFKRVVAPYKPQVIVFYAGDNDIDSGKSADQVVADYQQFVKMVKAQMPHTTIIFISLKPTESRWSLWPVEQQANEMIRLFCEKDDRLVFIDAASVLLNDSGKPNPDYFLSDKLHLNNKGYQKWNELLRPVIERALARKAD